MIAEYDSKGNLLRKYVYGPRVDEPVCMIDLADSNAVYYHHFDGLGSVVALTDANGTCVQTYEYSVYGHVAASDPNHPNPFMFTGRQFDVETGLYYYRARYYNPYIGRFLQTDPVGYGYAYCGNNPVCWVDPTGLIRVAFYDPDDVVLKWGAGPDGRPIRFPVDTGSMFAEYADDTYFDFSYSMRPPEEIQEQRRQAGAPLMTPTEWMRIRLLALKREGYKITDVYFYDHAYVDDDTERVYGLEFGDQGLFVADGTLEEFCRTLGGIVKDGAFHFRGCNVGNEVNYDLLENLAIWTGGMVTGPVTGILPPGGKVVERTFRDPSTGKVIDIPDYISPSGYSVAYPCGYIYTPWDRDWPCIPWCPRGPY